MLKRIPIEPTYRKDNGLWNLYTNSLPFPKGFKAKERGMVYIPPGEYGGNHKHPRTEAFIGIGRDLVIIWQDSESRKHEDKMMDGEQLYLTIIEPLTPHAVVNRSKDFALLAEFADGPNINVEKVELLDKNN